MEDRPVIRRIRSWLRHRRRHRELALRGVLCVPCDGTGWVQDGKGWANFDGERRPPSPCQSCHRWGLLLPEEVR